ncbi:MAG: FecR domain-containing protein [Steroidobacteraceae bacterium]
MNEPPGTSHDSLARLIEAAGRREAPPAHAYERALAATTEIWQAKVRRRRWRIAAGMAAGVAIVTVGTFVALRSIDSGPRLAEPIANVARIVGAVSVRSEDSRDWTSLREDRQSLPSGSVLRTGAGSGVALQIDDVSVRIAERAEVVLESRWQLRLVHGKVYIDTGPDGGVGRMLVVSEVGTISDVGTQFEVQYRRGAYRLRVREGEVVLQRGAEQLRSRAGEQVSIDSNGIVSSATIAPDDPAWRWVHVLASAPDIDNQPLTTLLAWVGRETGVAVRYASPAIERRANGTILHGSIRGLEPLEALAVMLATTDLRHEVLADGTIMIK